MKRKLTMILMMLGASIGFVLAGGQSAAAQAASGCATPSFAAAANFGAGDAPASVTTADFNADGRLDIVTANARSDNVSVLLGNGSGGFAPAVNFRTGVIIVYRPVSVTTGDFNADGKLDIVTANFESNNISVLLGDGLGGFAPAVNFRTANFFGEGPFSVTTGDFNADGKLDLAAANRVGGTVSILRGDGLGGFSTTVPINLGTGPFSVTTGDFNSDGKLDLATANFNSNNVSVLLGNGAGSFSAPAYFNAGNGAFSVTTGDFNADGKLDLATANQNSDNISILLGNGLGGFSAPNNFDAGDAPASVTTGDFNADGKLDLATAIFNSDNVSVLLGDGLGGFSAPYSFGAGDASISVTTGDFNADGRLDIVTANAESDNVSLFLNVCGLNTAPTAVDDAYSTDEDTALNVAAPGVLANDTDGEMDTLTATIVSNPSNAASFTFNDDGSFDYTPAANFNGADSFTYKISDGELESNTATVMITVNAVNDPPTITAAVGITRQQAAGASNSQIATVNDTEDAENTLTVTVNGSSSATVNGVTVSNIAVNATGNVTANVAAACGATGANFTLRVTDSGSLFAQATLNVAVTLETTLPVINLSSTVIAPFPNNHKYTTIQVSQLVASVSDNCSTLAVSDVRIAQVTSDEVDNAPGDGNTVNDIVIGGDCKSVQLRAERDGNRNGRVYTVTLRLRDAAGNTTTATKKITVPLSQNGSPAIDDGAAYTVISGCP